MADPLRRDLVARRNTPFAFEWDAFVDASGSPYDFALATVTMQVRQYGAQPGTALISLVEVGTDFTEGLIAEDGSIRAFIDIASLHFLPLGKPGEPVSFAYDVIVARAGIVPEIWVQGDFTVKPGVTDRLILLSTEADEYLLAEDGAYLETE